MIAIVLGARPEIIKMSPVTRECAGQDIPYHVLHSGQHYSCEMDRVFFNELELPGAQYNLDVGSGTQANQTGKILLGVEQVLEKQPPDIVLVQGDTNSVMAGTLAAVIRDLVTRISEMMGFSGQILWDASKPDGQPKRCLGVNRAENDFGFLAKTPFREGLNKTIQWYN